MATLIRKIIIVIVKQGTHGELKQRNVYLKKLRRQKTSIAKVYIENILMGQLIKLRLVTVKYDIYIEIKQKQCVVNIYGGTKKKAEKVITVLKRKIDKFSTDDDKKEEYYLKLREKLKKGIKEGTTSEISTILRYIIQELNYQYETFLLGELLGEEFKR
jgi:hypothetical protein